MNVPSPVITQSISTLPEVEAAPQAAPGTTESAPPGSTSGAASVAGPPKGQDKNAEVAKRFAAAAERESKSRRIEREAQEKLTAAQKREEELSQREAALKAKEAELDDAIGDPVGHMLKKGMDPVKVAERYAKPESQEEKRIRLLEEKLAAREEADRQKADADAKSQKEWEAEQKTQARNKSVKDFVGSISTKECPNLTTLYEPKHIPGLVDDLLNGPVDPAAAKAGKDVPTFLQAFVRKYRRNPTDAEVRECLEYNAAERATKLLAGRQASAEQVDREPNSQVSPKSESGPKGISNQHASQTVSPAKRPLTLEEKRKKNRKRLVEDLEAESANDD